MTFKDHFSNHAQDYAAFRPTYPDELFRYVAECCEETRLAWDCATGNGQCAEGLTAYFDKIVATDASEQQIRQAAPHPRITYRVALADQSGLADCSVDLITVAQALHWFNLDSFYAEVQRVLKPNGVLAVWCYELMTIQPAIDAVIRDFYERIVGPFWPPERQILAEGYRTIAFPFEELTPPPFYMQVSWTFPQVLNYLSTWSACQRFTAALGKDPLDEIHADLESVWGTPSQSRLVSWKLHLRVGRPLPHSGQSL